MVSSLRDAIFLCPKPMKEKGRLLAGGGRRRARAAGSVFAGPPLWLLCVLVLGTIHPPIGPSSLGSVGETDRWVDTSPLYPTRYTQQHLTARIRYFCSTSPSYHLVGKASIDPELAGQRKSALILLQCYSRRVHFHSVNTASIETRRPR